MHTYVKNFRSRAIVKFNSAVQQFSLTEETFMNWLVSAQPLIMPIQASNEDKGILTCFRPTPFTPPIQEMVESFTSGAHSLRVALDAFAMEIAYLDTGIVKNEQSIAFPIVTRATSEEDQESVWDRNQRVKALARSVPSSIMQRFKKVQKWSQPDTIIDDFLSVLTSLDNPDKHVFGNQLDILPLPFVGLPQIPDADPKVSGKEQIPWITFEFDEQLLPCSTAVDLQGNMLPLLSFQGKSAHLFDLQEALLSDTWRVIQFLASGEWPERDQLQPHCDGPVVQEGAIPNHWRLQHTEWFTPPVRID